MKAAISQFNPDDFVLNPTHIDVWQFPLNVLWSSAASVLDEEELTRAKRFHFVRHQRRFTLAHAAVRYIIAQYKRTPPKSLIFSYTKEGKPYLGDDNQIQFNLSHSGELALLAVGQQFPMGVDLEFFSARPYYGIAKQLFSDSEISVLEKAPLALKPWIFFRIWTQKEAFIKACGLGLSYPTASISMPIVTDKSSLLFDNKKTSWKMTAFMPLLACPAALCHHPSITDIRHIQLSNLDTFFNEKS